MYLVTYLGDLCNGLTLLIIGRKQIPPLETYNIFIYCAAVMLTAPHSSSSRCDCSIFSATFLQTTPGKISSPSLLILFLTLTFKSIKTHSCCLLCHRSRWTALLQTSRPKEKTSRTCEYTAIFWHNVVINSPLFIVPICKSGLLQIHCVNLLVAVKMQV